VAFNIAMDDIIEDLDATTMGVETQPEPTTDDEDFVVVDETDDPEDEISDTDAEATPMRAAVISAEHEEVRHEINNEDIFIEKMLLANPEFVGTDGQLDFSKIDRSSEVVDDEVEERPRKRRHRYRSGTVALRQIRKEQLSVENIIPRLPFDRLVREITQDLVKGDNVIRFRREAIDALQCAAEAYVIDIMEETQKNAIFAGRQEIMVADMAKARDVLK
jgi:histone H3/H4